MFKPFLRRERICACVMPWWSKRIPTLLVLQNQDSRSELTVRPDPGPLHELVTFGYSQWPREPLLKGLCLLHSPEIVKSYAGAETPLGSLSSASLEGYHFEPVLYRSSAGAVGWCFPCQAACVTEDVCASLIHLNSGQRSPTDSAPVFSHHHLERSEGA